MGSTPDEALCFLESLRTFKLSRNDYIHKIEEFLDIDKLMAMVNRIKNDHELLDTIDLQTCNLDDLVKGVNKLSSFLQSQNLIVASPVRK